MRLSRIAIGITTVGFLSGPVGLCTAQEPAQGKASSAKAFGTDRPEDEKAVKSLLAAYVEAYNAHKADAIGALLEAQALLLDPDGAELEGRDAIVAHYKAAFDAGETDTLAGTTDALRFLGTDVASLRGVFHLVGKNGAPSSSGRFRMLAHRVQGKWLLSELHDYAAVEPEAASNREKLQDLEWMVGDWVDESEDVRLTSQVRWDDSQNFLVRTFTLAIGKDPATSGSQIIGWDPRGQQIRSWVFDSNGGFGEAIWLHQADRWVIKSTGVLRDGRTTTSTLVMEPLSADQVRVHSYDRTIGDDAAPDVANMIMVRKPPDPATPKAPEDHRPK